MDDQSDYPAPGYVERRAVDAGESARALMDLSVHERLPLGNGILTVENEDQAWARARVSEMNKGGGAAEAALGVLRHVRRLKDGAHG